MVPWVKSSAKSCVIRDMKDKPGLYKRAGISICHKKGQKRWTKPFETGVIYLSTLENARPIRLLTHRFFIKGKHVYKKV